MNKIISNRWQTLDGFVMGLSVEDRGVCGYHTDKGIVFLLDDRDPYDKMGGLWLVDVEPFDNYLYNEVVDALDTKLISQAEQRDQAA